MKSFIYLPIEVSRRELPSKVMLAHKLSKLGFTTIIFEHTYFDRIGWKYPGIYLGKNFFRTETPASKEFYNKMKNKNINIWHLDEEGGMFGENSNDNELKNFLEYRLDVSQLSGTDRVYCWGDIQKKYYDSKNINKILIKVSGTPNFEILKPEYGKEYLNIDLKITNGYKNFILVNTRSVYINPRKTFKNAVGSGSGGSNIFFQDHGSDILLEDSIMLGEIVKLVNNISLNYKDEIIILRPHPEESLEIYKFYLRENKNVIVCNDDAVDSWIRLSKLVIQYGCTTAVQADFAKKQVLSFMPSTIKNSTVREIFLNKIGIEISNFDDFKNYFDNPFVYRDSSSIWSDLVSNKNSFEFLANEINNFAKSDKSYFIKKNPVDLRFDIKENLKIHVKNIYKNKIHEMQSFEKINDYFDAAANYYRINIDPIKISPYCYIIPGTN